MDRSELMALHQRGSEAWPDLSLEFAAFSAHVSHHDLARGDLDSFEVEDFFLACACSEGHDAAVVAFDRRFGADLGRPAKGDSSDLAKDLEQIVRSKLFASETPKIAEYSGRGSLQGWVRIVAKRTYLDMVRALSRRRDREHPGQDLLDGVVQIDPELEYLKRHYKDEFREAFHGAVRSLAFKDRTMLRHNLVFGLSIDDIGRLHDVHRATAARWVNKARDALLQATRANMRARLGVGGDELESIMRLIESRLDVSVIRYLRED